VTIIISYLTPKVIFVSNMNLSENVIFFLNIMIFDDFLN
jgi:hypothetical protein